MEMGLHLMEHGYELPGADRIPPRRPKKEKEPVQKTPEQIFQEVLPLAEQIRNLLRRLEVGEKIQESVARDTTIKGKVARLAKEAHSQVHDERGEEWHLLYDQLDDVLNRYPVPLREAVQRLVDNYIDQEEELPN